MSASPTLPGPTCKSRNSASTIPYLIKLDTDPRAQPEAGFETLTVRISLGFRLVDMPMIDIKAFEIKVLRGISP